MDARTFGKRFAFASLALATIALTALPSVARGHQQDSSQQSTGDAVADAARKAREQKNKDTAKPKKVYTDDDVNHSTSTGAPATGDANTAAAKGRHAKGPGDKG